MSYQVIARKWRPQNFEEVIGQTATAQTLRNAILQNRIAHAYLFAGARGVGKTSTARILAKALNCVQGPTANPCNVCDACTEITSGNSLDVLEIDAASNRGIDEIRELRENVKYAAARDRYKVFIIDEVHMLTTEAFNALLKTLEEPPSQVVFILATTELHKVPSTILSRCQHFNFRAISYQEVLAQLRKIAEAETIHISDRALIAIARASEGSMRDAQSQFDQIISFCGREIQDEQVRDLLGIVPQQILDDFTRAIVNQDARGLMGLVEDLVMGGLNLQHFVREMLAHLRNMVMIKIVGSDPQVIPLAPSEMQQLEDLANNFSEEDLTRAFQILMTAKGDMRRSSHPRFHLEMALVKVLHAKRLVPIEQFLAGFAPPTAESQSTVAPSGSAQLPQSPKNAQFAAAAPARAVRESSPGNAAHLPSRGVIEELKLAVLRSSPMVSSLLEHASIHQEATHLHIEFAKQDRFSYEMLRTAENLELVRDAVRSATTQPLTVQVVLAEASTDIQTSPPQVESEGNPSVDPKRELLDRASRDSRIRAFLDTFHGEITDVKNLE